MLKGEWPLDYRERPGGQGMVGARNQRFEESKDQETRGPVRAKSQEAAKPKPKAKNSQETLKHIKSRFTKQTLPVYTYI